MDLPALKKMIAFTVQEEMCLTVEDFLSRRTRQLLLDAGIARAKAPDIARMLAAFLHKDEHWIQEQINNFKDISKHYLPE